MRPHDAQHPRAGDSDPIQDPKPCVDLAMAFAVERGPSEIGTNRRQQLRVRLPRPRPPPRRPRARPVGCPRPPRVERRARALPDLTHPLDAETSPRRASPPLARRDDPLSRARGQPWPAPATLRAGRSPRPPHGTAPPAIRHAGAAAPRRASGWRSTAAPAPGSPPRPPPHPARTPVALRAPSVRADPSACTTSLDRTISPTSLDIGFSLNPCPRKPGAL